MYRLQVTVAAMTAVLCIVVGLASCGDDGNNGTQAGNNEVCNAGQTCTQTCDSVDNDECNINCLADSQCSATCREGQNCAFRCDAGASCDFDCTAQQCQAGSGSDDCSCSGDCIGTCGGVNGNNGDADCVAGCGAASDPGYAACVAACG